MAQKSKQLSDQLRQVIARSGVSRYRIWKDTGIHQAALSKFMSGERGVSTRSLDLLGEYFDLELQPRASRARKKR